MNSRRQISSRFTNNTFLVSLYIKVTETIGFFPIQILIFWTLRNNADAHISSLGYLWFTKLGETLLNRSEQLPVPWAEFENPW